MEEPIKEPLQNINIELFEGDNYIYLLDMVGNKLCAEYPIKNDFTDMYVTKNEMNSAINQTAGQIELTVNQKLTEYATEEQLEGAVTELNSTIIQKADEITSTVSSTYTTKDELNTAKSQIKQTTDSIGLEVNKKVNNSDYTPAQILLMINNDESEVKIKGDKIDINGKAVKFKTDINSSTHFTEADRDRALNGCVNNDLSEQEKELYDIDTDGEVDVMDVQEIVDALVHNNGDLNVKGTLEIDPYSGKRTIILRDETGKIMTSIGLRGIQSGNIGARFIKAYNLKVLSNESSAYTNIVGNDDACWISMHGRSDGNSRHSINLTVDEENAKIEVSRITNSSHTTITPDKIETPKVYINSLEALSGNDNNIYVGTDGGQTGKTTSLRGNTVRLYAHSGGAVYLGYSGSTAVTSDEKLKDIADIDEKYIEFFKNLKPITYVYKNKGHRDHIGFGARQVEKALGQAGLTTEQFAGVLKDTNVTISADEMGTEEDVHYDELYSLRYEEFIALNTMMIQKQAKEIEELKTKVEELEAKK